MSQVIKSELQYLKVLINSNCGVGSKNSEYLDRLCHLKYKLHLIEKRKFKKLDLDNIVCQRRKSNF